MSVLDYELGKHPGPPALDRVEVDPITLRVLGGAFHAIAKEMAGVLFRMSYSSIIRESEDLGAGVFDARGPRALRVGLDADAHRLAALVHPRLHAAPRGEDRGRRRDHPQPPVLRRVAQPRHRAWRCRSSARASSSASRPSRRTCSTSAASFPGINADVLRHVRRGEDLRRAALVPSAASCNEDLDKMVFDNVRTETMNRGDMNAMMAACQLGRDRFLRLVRALRRRHVMSAAYDWMDYSRARCCASRSGSSRTASTRRRPAGSTTTRATAACRSASRRR